MKGRQFWQAILDWFRPSQNETVSAWRGTGSTGASIDPTGPLAVHRAVGADAFGDGASAVGMADSMADSMMAEEVGLGIDECELDEFLAADHDPVPADPVFRDALRDQLWALVQDGVITGPKNH